MCWGDHVDDGLDYGCYRTMRTREAALRYAASTVLERAANCEVKILDQEDWKTERDREYVLGWLREHGEFTIPLSFTDWPGCEEPSVSEYVCVGVQKVYHYDR